MGLSNTLVNRALLTKFALPAILVLLVLTATFTWHHASKRSAVNAVPPTASKAQEAYGRIPLSFETNQGQTDASVDFLARGAGYTLFLKPTEAVFQLRKSDSRLRTETSLAADSENPQSDIRAQQSKVLRMTLVGADNKATPKMAEALPGKVNYFNGSDSSKWRTDISTYARVHYSQVYPGVDLVYYGNQRQLEYDFVVAPGSDTRAIKLQFEGADRVGVNAAGDLLLNLGEDVIRQPKPLVYQEIGGERRTVKGDYLIDTNGEVGFAVGDYDLQRPLIIDPVLVYSTYLGGSGTDEGVDIAVDSAGSAYICGDTTSTNFPTANALDTTFGGGTFSGARDAFVTKLNPAGTALVYSTYLGGSGGGADNGDDRCSKIKVDSSGNAYVAGETHSADFPTANALQGTYGGGFSDAYVTKLNAAGSALVYSTFLGGTIFDAAHALTIDSSGNAYVTGRTTSADFPTVSPIQAVYSGGPGADAFVTKINAAGSALVYSTYLGGNGGNGFTAGFSIAVDSSGNAYLTGQTRATNFPTANAIQATFGGGFPDGDAFVTKLNAAGSALVYSTYLGGGDNDIGFEIAVDSAGSAHVAGTAASSNFPVANAFQGTLSGTSDGFVTKLNAAGSALAYSTYIGGTGGDSVNGVAIGANGNAYITGGTTSTDFPMVNPTQGTSGGSTDGFVAQFNAAGSALLYSTYLGGNGSDAALAITVDPVASMYITGRTSSTNFPTLNPVQATNGGGQDAFVTKISDPPPLISTFQFNQAAYLVIEDVTFVTVTVTRLGDNSAAATVDYATADGTASERADYTTALGTLRFAAGETSKTFDVLVNEDSKVEPLENFSVALSNPTAGASLGTQATTAIQVQDDLAEPTSNAIDDSTIFVGQHYHDFLNRQSDPAGLAFWVNQIEDCGADAQCRAAKRTNVSAAFFMSIEFQHTGYLVFRIYKETFTDSPGRPRGMPRYRELLRDTQEIRRDVMVGMGNWEQQLEANKQAFAERWVQTPEFLAEFPISMTAEQFVDKLFLNSEVTPSSGERNAAIATFGIGDVAGRAAALRNVADSFSVYNRQYNPAFVLMQYIGYLRRNPNDSPEPALNYAGYDFWLAKMNQFSLPGEDVRDEGVALARAQRAEMVRAFIISGEYRGRFSQ